MKKVFFSTLICAIMGMAMISCSAQAPKAPKANLKTETDSLAYSLGMSMTEGLDMYLMQRGVDSTEIQVFVDGLLSGLKMDENGAKKESARALGIEIATQINKQMLPGLTKEIFSEDTTKSVNKDAFVAGFLAGVLKKDMIIKKEDASSYAQDKMEAIKAVKMEKQYGAQKEANTKFLEENKSKEGVVTTASGLQYKIITQGTGPKPTVTDHVKVHYVGTTIDGLEFDSSVKRGEPATFEVEGRIIKGWTEALLLMPVGSKYELFIPYNLAYGAEGQPGSIEPFATLIFEVELLGIEK